ARGGYAGRVRVELGKAVRAQRDDLHALHDGEHLGLRAAGEEGGLDVDIHALLQHAGQGRAVDGQGDEPLAGLDLQRSVVQPGRAEQLGPDEVARARRPLNGVALIDMQRHGLPIDDLQAVEAVLESLGYELRLDVALLQRVAGLHVPRQDVHLEGGFVDLSANRFDVDVRQHDDDQ